MRDTSRRRRGRPVVGAFSGLVFGLFLGLDLLLTGQVALDSPVLTVAPVGGLVLGIALGLWAPLGRRTHAPEPTSETTPGPDREPEVAS